MRLSSYKLRFRDRHVRVLPSTNADGSRFDGPGVDLRGPSAEEAFVRAASVLAWLEARERGMTVRSLLVDLDTRRVIVTFEAIAGRPIVVRIDAADATELFDRARTLTEWLAIQAEKRVAARPK